MELTEEKRKQIAALGEDEKRKRIAELRAELKELQATPRSDWHKAFEALLRLTIYKYKGVSIQTEVEIGVDAPRMDYMILTEEKEQEFEESIFKIFRQTNVLEFKRPSDALNWRVIYKIIGYAGLLIGTAEHENDMPKDQVTISIFRSVKNPELFKEMEESGELVRTETPGIYHVTGLTKLPFQIVITSELEGEEYAAYRALTDRAGETDIERVIDDLENETNDVLKDYYGIFLNLIAEKNLDVFAEIRRDDAMKYPALMKVFEEDVNAQINEKVRAQEQKTTVDHLKDIMESFKCTIEQAMDVLHISQDERATYAGLVQKKM
mgnify:CR=1 FL=1